jgi:hypothetical protein
VKILVRTISPRKTPFDFKAFEREFRKEFNTNIKQDVLSDFDRTVDGWRNKPDFGSKLRIFPHMITFDVFAIGKNADQYNLVDAGSPEHPIVPHASRPGGRLRYRRGYTPATTPRVISSRRSQRSGPFVIAKAVNHPGFEGREFYKTIGEDYLFEYRRRIKNALERATRRLRREQGM